MFTYIKSLQPLPKIIYVYFIYSSARSQIVSLNGKWFIYVLQLNQTFKQNLALNDYLYTFIDTLINQNLIIVEMKKNVTT